jgi:DNA-binding transcriptional ArsR family regulator
LKPDRDITDPRVAKALAHPLRVRILAVLDDRTASPSEISAELGAPLGVVSYHVRHLARNGFLKLVRKKQRRGAIEHYYRAESRPVLTSEAWSEVPGIVKKALVDAAVSQVAASVSAAVGAGGFERGDAHITRSPLVLDEQAFSEVASKLDGLLEEFERIGTEAEARLAAADHEGQIKATAVLMLFEGPETPALRPPAPVRDRARRAGSRSEPAPA